MEGTQERQSRLCPGARRSHSPWLLFRSRFWLHSDGPLCPQFKNLKSDLDEAQAAAFKGSWVQEQPGPGLGVTGVWRMNQGGKNLLPSLSNANENLVPEHSEDDVDPGAYLKCARAGWLLWLGALKPPPGGQWLVATSLMGSHRHHLLEVIWVAGGPGQA